MLPGIDKRAGLEAEGGKEIKAREITAEEYLRAATPIDAFSSDIQKIIAGLVSKKAVKRIAGRNFASNPSSFFKILADKNEQLTREKACQQWWILLGTELLDMAEATQWGFKAKKETIDEKDKKEEGNPENVKERLAKLFRFNEPAHVRPTPYFLQFIGAIKIKIKELLFSRKEPLRLKAYVEMLCYFKPEIIADLFKELLNTPTTEPQDENLILFLRNKVTLPKDSESFLKLREFLLIPGNPVKQFLEKHPNFDNWLLQCAAHKVLINKDDFWELFKKLHLGPNATVDEFTLDCFNINFNQLEYDLRKSMLLNALTEIEDRGWLALFIRCGAPLPPLSRTPNPVITATSAEKESDLLLQVACEHVEVARVLVKHKDFFQLFDDCLYLAAKNYGFDLDSLYEKSIAIFLKLSNYLPRFDSVQKFLVDKDHNPIKQALKNDPNFNDWLLDAMSSILEKNLADISMLIEQINLIPNRPRIKEAKLQRFIRIFQHLKQEEQKKLLLIALSLAGKNAGTGWLVVFLQSSAPFPTDNEQESFTALLKVICSKREVAAAIPEHKDFPQFLDKLLDLALADANYCQIIIALMNSVATTVHIEQHIINNPHHLPKLLKLLAVDENVAKTFRDRKDNNRLLLRKQFLKTAVDCPKSRELVLLLLQWGAPLPNESSKDDQLFLIEIVSKDIQLAKALFAREDGKKLVLTAGIIETRYYSYDGSLLELAAFNGDFPLLILVVNRLNINLTRTAGVIALHSAIRGFLKGNPPAGEHLKVIQFLIEQNVDVNAVYAGSSALEKVVSHQNRGASATSIACLVEMLTANGAIWSGSDEYKHAPKADQKSEHAEAKDAISVVSFNKVIRDGDYEGFAKLLENSSGLELALHAKFKFPAGNLPLLHGLISILEQGGLKFIEFLNKKFSKLFNILVSSRLKGNITPLLYLLQQNCHPAAVNSETNVFQAVEMLLNGNGQKMVNVQEERGRLTPLMVCSKLPYGRKLAEVLLARGACFLAPRNWSEFLEQVKTPQAIAYWQFICNNCLDIAEIRDISNRSIVDVLSKEHNFQLLQLILKPLDKKNADTLLNDNIFGTTPLLEALEGLRKFDPDDKHQNITEQIARFRTIWVLVAHGARWDVSTGGYGPQTALAKWQIVYPNTKPVPPKGHTRKTAAEASDKAIFIHLAQLAVPYWYDKYQRAEQAELHERSYAKFEAALKQSMEAESASQATASAAVDSATPVSGFLSALSPLRPY